VPDLAEAVEAVIAELHAGGLRATADLADLNPPGVIVRAPVVTYRFKGGTWAADWTAHAVALDPGFDVALKILGPLLTDVQTALGFRIVTARPVLVQTADGNELPAYEMTWSDRIT
jgi:hypothetical protein